MRTLAPLLFLSSMVVACASESDLKGDLSTNQPTTETKPGVDDGTDGVTDTWNPSTDPWTFDTALPSDADADVDADADGDADADADADSDADADADSDADSDADADADSDADADADSDADADADSDADADADSDADADADTDADADADTDTDTDTGTGTGIPSGDTGLTDDQICINASQIAGYLDQFQTAYDKKVLYCHSGSGGNWTFVDSDISSCVPHLMNHSYDIFPTTGCDS